MQLRFLLVLTVLISPLWAKETLIKNATVMTVSQGTIENGSILIRDGKIVEVGTNVNAATDAEVIDAAGKFVTPGIIDCHSHIAADSINEGSVSVSSMTGIEDVLDASDFNIYRDMAGGVTTSNILHGSANPIGGKNAVIKLRWGKPVSELLFQGAKPGIKFALGENTKRRGIPLYARNNPRRYPSSRMGVEDVIRSAFQEAKDYAEAWEQYNTRKTNGERVIPPKRDFRLEPLVEIMRGERLLHSHCYRADEIVMLIRVAEDFGFQIATFQHVLEGYKVAKEIAAHGAGASTFSDWWAYKEEAYDAIPHNAAIMTRQGVLVSINSDSAEEARHLNQEAGKTMRYGGLSENEALALVTLNPAKQLQIDDRVGSIESGKDADLVIYRNHPLSVYAVPEMVFIDGEIYYSAEKDAQRMKRLEAERQRLLEMDEKKPAKEKSGDIVDVTGAWEVVVNTPDATYQLRFDLEQEGNSLNGQVVADQLGTFSIYDGTVEGDHFSFRMEVNVGEGPEVILVEATVDGDRIRGTAGPEGQDAAPLEGNKIPGRVASLQGGGR